LANLKVLFLATRDSKHPGVAGGDINMWECARYLASEGHAVTFATSKYPGSARAETFEGVHIVRLGGIWTLWLTSFWYYLTQCRKKFDVVIAEGFGGSRIPRLAPLYVREPIVTEWRQIHRAIFAAQYPGAFGPVLNILERATAAIHRNTRLIAYTREWKEQFPTLGFRPQNVFVVPVSLGDRWLSIDRAPQRRSSQVAWLGKFRRYKYPDVAILAISRIAQAVPDVRLVLAGRHDDRRYERRLYELVREHGLEHIVDFQFDISEAQKEELLLSSRVLLLPSAIEGFGIVVLEANACGVPVVASSGVPESSVREGFNGLRYPLHDLSSLVEKTLRLLTDDDLFTRLSDNSRAFAQTFKWEAAGKRFEEVVLGAVQEMRTQV
jgi:glycosyltransferase involved in cell wall biosynthesis